MSGFYDDFIEDGDEGFACETMSEAEIDKIVKETLGDSAADLERMVKDSANDAIAETISEELDDVDLNNQGC